MSSMVYTVFRRNDGYVNAIATSSAEVGLAKLRPQDNKSFTIIIQTTRWTVALAEIDSARALEKDAS